jgi:hypothetical protein
VRGWRNWQTRMFEGHMAQAVWVQIPPRAPYFAFYKKTTKGFVWQAKI